VNREESVPFRLKLRLLLGAVVSGSVALASYPGLTAVAAIEKLIDEHKEDVVQPPRTRSAKLEPIYDTTGQVSSCCGGGAVK